jgi:hypothetical protein
MSEKKSSDKKRNWAFTMYPDSAPENWKELLQQTGLQCCVSPLHDIDVNADISQKKAHWHVILSYSGPTSYSVVEKISVETFKGTIPQALEQIKGYHRYLTHKDNPEKAQYNECDIININGFSIRDYVELSKSEVTKLKMEITDYIEENDIREYQELLFGLRKDNLTDMWEVAANNTIFADAYCRSRRHKLQELTPTKSPRNPDEYVPPQ